MAKSFTQGFYSALRSNREEEEEKKFSSSTQSETKKENTTSKDTTSKSETASKNKTSDFTSRFYSALKSTPEPEKKYTPTIPDFRGQIATSEEEEEEKGGSFGSGAGGSRGEATTSGATASGDDASFLDTLYDKYIDGVTFLPTSWDDFATGMAYNTERLGAGLLGMGESITDFVGAGTYGILEGVTSLGGLAPNKVSEWSGAAADKFLDNSVSERWEESIKERYNPTEADENWSGLVQEVGKILSTGVAGKILGAFGGGAQALGGVDEATKAANLSKGIFGTYAAGAGTNEAHDEGASLGQALTYGTTVGAMETTIESIAGGIPGFGGGKLTDAVQKVFSSPIVSRLVDVVGEGGEEALSAIVTPFIKRAVYDSDAELATADEIAEAALLGMVTSGILQAGVDLPNAVSSAVNNRRNRQSVTQQTEEAAPEIIEQEPMDVEAVLAEVAREAVAQENNAVEIDSEEGRQEFPAVNRVLDEAEAAQQATAQPVREVRAKADSAEAQTENAPRTAANAEEWADIDGAAIREELTRRETEGSPFVERVMDDVETRAAQAAYEAGKADVPRDKVTLTTTAQEEAYQQGRMDHIADLGKKAQSNLENTGNQAYTGSEKTTKKAAQTTQQTYTRSDPELSDLGTQLSIRDVATVNGVKYTLNMGSDGKYSYSIDRDTSVMNGYVTDARAGIFKDGPFETRGEAVQAMMDFARFNKLVDANKEVVTNGEEVAEVSDRGRVLESDVSGQSDGGLLDGLASENVSEDARGGDAVSAPEIRGRETAGNAGGSDSQRTGRGRSLGSGEGRDLQPDTGAISEEAANERSETGTIPEGVLRDGADAERVGDRGTESQSDIAERARGNRASEAGSVKENDNGQEERSGEAQTVDAGTQAETGDRSGVSEEVRGDRQEVQRAPAGVQERRRVTEDAAEYDVPLNMVKAEEWPAEHKNHPAYTRDGQFYVKEDFAADLADKLIPHEAAHAMRQMNFGPYMDLLERLPDMFNRETEGGQTLLARSAEHRGVDLFGEMTVEQMDTLYDEITAYVSSAAVKDIDGPIMEELREAFHDYDAYKAELKDVHQKFKDRNKGTVETETETATEPVDAEVVQKTELATQEQPRGNNFSIPETGLKLPKGEKARFKANVEAIKTLRSLMAENRRATPAEQEILSKYVGWGGLANAFDEKKADWAKEYKQLKNLLTDKEYASARSSTLNAHYTDVGVIRAIYNGLAGIGFKGGRLLEPSAGIGHFAGAMPAELAGNGTSWIMVELDELTGNIAKYLYPNADVRVQGFENTKIPDDYMDAAISNVPFGNYAIADKKYPKAVTGAIHNYFFAKALDKVRPGGIVTFITSRYTMDAQDSSVRHYIAQRADLLGAIRLPNTAFKSNAGTEVVTDILILKKRAEGTPYGGEQFENTGSHHWRLSIYEQTNEYFEAHPEMVLGTAEATSGMYRGNSLTYAPKPGNLNKQIEKAFASIKGKMDYPAQRSQEEIRREIKQAAGKAKNGQIIKKDGKLYRSQDGVLQEAAEISKANEAIVSDVIELRDTARKLLDAQLDGSEAQAKTFRKELNTQYDAFVKKHGILNSQKNKRLINLDVDAPFILALENYDKEHKTATKADIFTKNTITPIKTVTSVNTVEEGLIVSMNETGGVDTKRIAELLGESEATVTRALLDNRLAFKNRDGKLETAEKYLAGNVKAKLRDAEALAEGDPDYQANVEELQKIIPADIAPEDISVQPGATWIPDSVYSDFAAETLGARNSEWRKTVTVTYNKLLNSFTVQLHDAWLKHRPENTSTWGTPDRSFLNIFEATLNSKSVTVKRKLEDGSSVLDKQATAAAQEKQEKIRAEFHRWLWDDDTRKETLARLYNDTFNNYVTPKYAGSNLIVNGSNAAKPLRPHQKDAVQRIINSGGNTLLAHKVGAGKTYEMAAAAMKLRQLGIVKKPMFVVPKSLVAQWGNEFLDFFPAAKILVLGEKDFSAANRKLFANRIATGDYDAVILSQEQFKAVPMSVENQEAFYQEQITALELTITETARASGKRDPSIKQMEKSKKSFEAKLKKLADMKKDADNIDFEQLGVDALFVDEAHSYKNLFYSTNMQNVAGLGNKDGSQKAFDLYMKVRHLQSLNGGRGIVFATATPVMNSMSEMYIMQKYLQGDLLEARGIHSFDAWASQFGEVRTVLEMNPSGKGFRQKQSFSRFKNLAELQQMFRAFADVLTEIPGLKIPTMKEGKRIIVESEPSEFQLDYIESLAQRADDIKNRKVKPEEDNMLKITSEGRKLGYTQRMIDPSLPYEADNKIMKAADNVLKIWKETKNIKGTQLIFCDLSTPKGGSNVETTTTEATDEVEDISIYDDIRNVLVTAGVPVKEIAFIHDANTNEKKAKLFKDVNDGKVRVLIGSTGKMGVGMNAQKRIVALHHLDAPWRPGDIEQREGRALRQGNINDEVGMYVYVTKQTFDSRMWDNLQRKATFIHQVMAGDLTARESEGDGDFALSAAEIKAISSGNPLIMEQFEVAAELSKLENLERAHAKEVSDAKKRIEKAKLEIVSDEMVIARLREDIATRRDTSGDNFKLTIGQKTYTERKAAGEALIAEAKKRLKIVRDVETMDEIGTFAGFKLYATNSGDLILRGKGQYRATVNAESAVGTAARLEEAVKRLDNMLAATTTRLQENKMAISKLEKTAVSTFDKADELVKLRQRNAEILAELNPEDEKNIAELADDEDTTDNMIDRQVSTDRTDQWTADRVGEDKTPMRLSEIVEKVRHDFGINITRGHIRGAGVLGQYDRQNKGIRTKIANDLPTVAHELGHHLDTTYALTDKGNLSDELKKELLDNLDQDMKDAYAEDRWPREGLAEFIRKYLQNRETAAIDYPEFTKYFLNRLATTDAVLIAQLADEVNAYYALDGDTATSSIRLREEGGPDARTFAEKIRDKASVMYQAWVDANHGIKLFDQATGSNAYTLANNAAYSDAMAGQIIVSDLTDANGQYVAPGLKTALQGINLNDKNEYRLFGEYLTVKHGPERLAEGMRIFADDRKNNSTFMERRRDELERQYPAFKEAAEQLYDFQTDFLKTWGVDTGLVSAESAKEWAERWHFYVPLNRAVSEDQLGIGAKRGFANQNSTIKKARGSGLDIVHPVDNIVNNIVKMVNAGVRNNVMRTITDQAVKMGANAEFLEKVPTPMVRRGFDMTGVKENLIEMLEGSDLKENAKETATDVVNTLDDVLYQYGRGKAHGDVITVLKDGKPEFWKINDPLLLQSVTTMSPQKMEGILDAYAVVSRFMTANITGYNVVWSLFSNFPRDIMTLFTYSKTKNPAKVFSAMGEAYMNKAGKSGKGLDPLYREYVAMGGSNISAYTADQNLAKRARKKLSGKNISANPIDWISFTSEVIEMGPRYATYKLLRESGLNPQEAFAGAMDITVNFRRGGRIARELNKVIPFFNVSVQGLDKFRRWITAEDAGSNERSKVVRTRVISYIGVSAALAALFYAINNGGEEEEKNYEQLSNYQKNSFWNIPLGDGKYFAIPKPRELGVLSSFFETAMEYGIGENNHAFDEFYAYAAQNLLPKIASDIAQVGEKGVVETGMSLVGNLGLVGVFGYMGANRDFLGRPIVSSGLQNLEPKDQYTNRTSKIAYWLGQATNSSPVQIDYFFQQVLGGFWKWQKALLPVGGENVDKTLGVKNTYVKDNQFTTDLVNWMYDQADKSKKAKNSDPGNMEKAITAKMDSNMTGFYSNFYGLAKDVTETPQIRGARQSVLDMIREYQKATDSGATTAAQRAVYAVAEKQGSTENLPSVMDTTVKDGNGKTHTLSPVQYVEYQTDYLRLYWESVESNLNTSATDAQQIAVLKSAKQIAKEEATRRTLSRIGVKQTDFFESYTGVDNDAIVTYKAKRTVANEDGSVKQDEVINIIESMIDDGLSSDAAYSLYVSEYSTSAKQVEEAKAAGVDADTFLEFKYNLNNLEYEKGVNGARKRAVQEMLDEMGIDDETYDFLFGTEYKTTSTSGFGGGFGGGFGSKFGK